jgi:hypothetical protein
MEQVAKTYRPGNVSYEKNKITVETETNSTSVLFEDISSLSFRKQSYFKGNKTIVVIGILIFFLSFISCFGTFDKSNPDASSKIGMYFFLSLGGLVVVIWGINSNKINFENVILETRGGSKVYFSVDEFEGEHIISSIEDKRREYQVSLSKKGKPSKKEIELENEIDTNITSSDILLQVEKLSKLKDSGILTQEEFDEQKTKLLSKL